MSHHPLPISYGPEAFTLRGKPYSYQVHWLTLGEQLSGRDKVEYVTVHYLFDGKFGVSVDKIEPMWTFTPAEFIALCERIGNRSSTPGSSSVPPSLLN